MQVMTEKAIRSIAYSLKKIEKSLDKIAKSTSSIDRLNGITANGQMSIFTDFESEQLTIGVD